MAKIEGIQFQGVVLAWDISEDKQAASVIIENLEISLGGYKRGPLVVTKVATISIPIEGNDQEQFVAQRVRGSASYGSSARAALVARLGGTTVEIDLQHLDPQSCFEHTLESFLPPNARYHASFFLVLERDSDDPEIGGSLCVDSLDIELKADSKASVR